MISFINYKFPLSVLVAVILSVSACSSGSNNEEEKDSSGEENQNNENPGEEEAVFKFLPAVESPLLDFSNSTVYWDLESNSIVTETDDWELSIKVDGHDYPIQVNGGASGQGLAGVGVLIPENAAAVTDPTDTTQVYRYLQDSATGALSKPGNYGPLQYNVEGGHQMWPTFATYLFKDMDENLYKAQILSNTGSDGTLASGNLVVRYAMTGGAAETVALDASDSSAAAAINLMNGEQGTTADTWHFAYQKYIGFMVNGGKSGDGGVSGCLANVYEALYDADGEVVADEFRNLGAENTLADFEAVELAEASCLDQDELFVADGIRTEIVTTDWLDADYSNGAPVFGAKDDPANSWIIRSASEDADGNYTYARMMVKTVTVVLGSESSRQVTLSVEAWAKE